MEAPENVLAELRLIRGGFELRLNPEAILVTPGSYSVLGHRIAPIYDGRWELWDTDPDGRVYMVMRVQNADGSYRYPDQRLVSHMTLCDPARYGGDPARMLAAFEAEAERLKEIEEKDFDDLAGCVARWCTEISKPKSGPGLSFRGKRVLAPGM